MEYIYLPFERRESKELDIARFLNWINKFSSLKAYLIEDGLIMSDENIKKKKEFIDTVCELLQSINDGSLTYNKAIDALQENYVS